MRRFRDVSGEPAMDGGRPQPPSPELRARSRARRMGVLLALLIALGAPAGCGSPELFPPPEKLTLFALNPHYERGGAESEEERFHGYRILGGSEIKEPERRAKLLNALKEVSLKTNDRAKCMFAPRHGLRTESAGKVWEYLICFECDTMYVFSGDLKEHRVIPKAPADLFNRTLREEGLPVPSGAEPPRSPGKKGDDRRPPT